MMVTEKWEARFILIVATLSIVIANHHHHHHHHHHHQEQNDNYVYSHPRIAKRGRNETQYFQDEMSLNLPPIRIPHLRHHHVTHWGPYFENIEADGDVSGSGGIVHHLAIDIGTKATLDCRVAMLSDKTVMWMRRDGERVSLLTVAKTTYSSDDRYDINFQYPNNWRLSIDSVKREDNGLYVCQVNTHPPRMLTVNVTILAPEIKIVDEAGHEVKDRYYKTGSGVELTCIVRSSSLKNNIENKLLPIWYKNDKKIPDHVKVYRVNGTDDKILTTRFYMERLSKVDSGEYKCSFDEHSASAVYLHVLNGEKQAAVHHDQWNSGEIKQESIVMILILLILLFTY